MDLSWNPTNVRMPKPKQRASVSYNGPLPKLSKSQHTSHERLLERIRTADESESVIHRLGTSHKNMRSRHALTPTPTTTSIPLAAIDNVGIWRRSSTPVTSTMLTTVATPSMVHSPFAGGDFSDTMESWCSAPFGSAGPPPIHGGSLKSKSRPVTSGGDPSSQTGDSQKLLILQQTSIGDAALQVVETGVAIAAQVSSFEELAEHGVFDADPSTTCHLSLPVLESIFKAKVKDEQERRHGLGGGGRVTISAAASIADQSGCGDRLMRFIQVINKRCQGLHFSVHGLGLGPRGLASVVSALIDDHFRQLSIEKTRFSPQQISECNVDVVGTNDNPAMSPSSALKGDGAGKKGRHVVIVADGNSKGGENGSRRQSLSQSQNPAGGNNARHITRGGRAGKGGDATSASAEHDLHYDNPAYAVVDVGANHGGEHTGALLAELLAVNTSIVALQARSAGMTNCAQTCQFFNVLASTNTTLTHLDLSGVTGHSRNCLWGETGMALAHMVSKNKVLSHLNVGDCGLEPEVLAALFEGMGTSSLVSLDVSNNTIDRALPARALSQMLAHGHCPLEILKLDGCSIGDKCLTMISVGLNPEAANLEGLGSADVSPRQNTSSVSKANAFKGKTNALNTSTAGKGTSRLAGDPAVEGRVLNTSAHAGDLSPRDGDSNPLPPTSHHLQYLSLTKNKFGAHGIRNFAENILKMPQLQKLDFSDNLLLSHGLDVEGLRLPDSVIPLDMVLDAIANTIKTFKELVLANCGLHTLPNRLSHLMSHGKALSTISLSGNPFGDTGAKQLADAIISSAQIRREIGKPFDTLCVTNCNISKAGMSVLLNGIASTRKMATQVDYYGRSMVTAPTAQPSSPAPNHFHGCPFVNLRLVQSHWTAWDGNLVDLLCHCPALETTDLGKYASAQLVKGLRRHRDERIANCLPKYKEQQDLVKKEEARFFETGELIADEQKRKEKALEMLKVARDKQKAAVSVMKNDIAALEDELHGKENVGKRASEQLDNTMSFLNEKREVLNTDKSRLLRKIETVEHMKQDFLSQIKVAANKQKKSQKEAQLTSQPSFLTSPSMSMADAGSGTVNLTAELNFLERQLEIIEFERDSEKSSALMLKKQVDDLNRLLGALGDGPSGTQSLNTSKKSTSAKTPTKKTTTTKPVKASL